MSIVTMREKTLEKQLAGQPKEVKFCKRCVMSNQRPRIVFDEEGICSACRFADAKKYQIDWQAREKELMILLDKYRRDDGHFDVVVPCSGGKDASYVAHQLKYKYGMNPLTITFAPFEYTNIGFQNFYNFTKSGFVNLLCHSSGTIHRKLARLGLEEVGDGFLPFIYGQCCFSIYVALRFNIKLIFYGENGEAEYGGETRHNLSAGLPLEEFAERYWKGTNVDELIQYGLETKSYFKVEDINQADLTFYRPPPLDEIRKADVRLYWFSYFQKWVPQENFYYAVEHTGFKANPERSEGTYSKYASLDDKTDGFHFYMMYIKFGIGRATADAAHEVRDGHLTREEAVALVRKYDGEFPKKYYKEFLDYVQMTEEEFWQAVNSFRQPHLWEQIDGIWKLKHQVS
jgi:N-acetyl sugar amidotransferase